LQRAARRGFVQRKEFFSKAAVEIGVRVEPALCARLAPKADDGARFVGRRVLRRVGQGRASLVRIDDDVRRDWRR
jgi:hypothetical protein